jgi:ribosomal protein S18 acetylase RimI-like enzyme
MDPIATVNRNMLEALAAFAWVKETGRTDSLPGLGVAVSGVRFGLFNTATLSTPAPGDGGDLDERLTRAGRYFAGHQIPWSFWLCEELLGASTRRRARLLLASEGLVPVTEAPGMIAESLPDVHRRLPVLDCRPVGDLETRTAFSRLMAAAFDMPPALAEEVYGSERLWRGPLHGWVGYYNGLPVTTTATVVSSDAVGVYAVGTHPLCQRRGYAEAVMRHALAVARRDSGIERSVLQSSAAGLGLYLRLGYRQVCRVTVFLKSAP